MKKKEIMRVVEVFVIAVVLQLSGCGSDFGTVPPDPDRTKLPKITGLKLVNYDSCDQLEVELRELAIQEMESSIEGLKNQCRWSGNDDCGDRGPGGSTDVMGEDSGSPSYTDTNVQEVGVDEGDLIKTDGEYTFAIIGDEVRIMKVWPVDVFARVSTIVPREGKPDSLYLVDNKLVMISTRDGAFAGTSPFYNNGSVARNNFVVVEVYDVRDPSMPRRLAFERHEGEYVNSRIVGSHLNLVYNNSLTMPRFNYILNAERPACNCDGTPRKSNSYLGEVEKLRARHMATLQGMEFSQNADIVSSRHGGVCTSVTRSHEAFGSEVLTIVRSDIGSEEFQSQKVSIIGNGGTIYSSRGNLYVGSKFRDFHALFSADENGKETVIHRFNFGGGELNYAGSNAIDGYLLDNAFSGSKFSSRYSMSQFSMSEHEGHFRVAVTKGWSESFVAVFKLNDDNFEPVGLVDGIGKDERIYAVRFMGDRAYIVTFKQIDPFYVIDLSTPTAPAIEGELKIPGFSTYLHPVDENRVIGLGYGTEDAGSFGWRQGVKLSLFDVSDPTNPIEVGHRIFGSRGSYSTAGEEHHAFTYDPARRLLALPLEQYVDGEVDVTGDYNSTGVLLIDVDDKGLFETVGEIETGTASANYSSSLDDGDMVLRSFIIGDEDVLAIMLLTENGVHYNMIDDNMSPIGQIN